eukprot:Tamp_21517.p2 GENE.Tamp_21517~~Tamp_21517.p2  ORF type:complete len:244 (+),score=23.90 Tamp_21517:34-732(+)
MASHRAWDFPAGCRALAAGQNSSGELGLGHAHNVVRDFAALRPPSPTPSRALFGAAACGGGYTLVYDEENAATLACGEQDGGSSGLAQPQRVLAALPALRGVRIRALASGLSHSLALAEDGRVFAWGRNADVRRTSGAVRHQYSEPRGGPPGATRAGDCMRRLPLPRHCSALRSFCHAGQGGRSRVRFWLEQLRPAGGCHGSRAARVAVSGRACGRRAQWLHTPGRRALPAP